MNSDGQQFHQYQQNQHSPLILTELTEPKKEHNIYDIGNSGPVLKQAQKCGWVKPVDGIQPFPLDNLISKVKCIFFVSLEWWMPGVICLTFLLST